MAQEPSGIVVEAEGNLAISNGRKFQKLNDPYMLPTDSDEHSRLDLQHEIVRLMLGGELYQTPELVKSTLSPQENTMRRILDVGAGSGKWYNEFARFRIVSYLYFIRAIEMARKFPHADVLGINLVEPNILSDPTRPVPSNCSFQIADANKDMGKISSGYDLVHVRFIEAGIDDSDLFFYDAARILRPGGLLLLVGGDVQLVDEHGKYVPLQKPGTVRYSHLQHLVCCLKEAHLKFGPPRLRYHFWRSMLESNPNYSNVQIKELLVPTGPRSNNLNETERKLAESMQTNLLRVLPVFKAGILHDKSLPEEFVNNLAEGAMKEVREMSTVIHRYLKFVFAAAVQNDILWAARKKPWQEPPGYDLYDYFVRPLHKE
ncbi:hypothetical protein M407DRAFT_26880 [Tulasnella calospora MUT 4182]|uniref:Methyltransferase type 11 domain-containing protein n=1 Tax=Tulasnella calospora MUT 4182 TaxID=1051891 RepID=A0A0C3LQH0_9AGAM|nr:hypothetical protein M407DRAFT_26880 [Tulasnella calospora MUT 4182]